MPQVLLLHLGRMRARMWMRFVSELIEQGSRRQGPKVRSATHSPPPCAVPQPVSPRAGVTHHDGHVHRRSLRSGCLGTTGSKMCTTTRSSSTHSHRPPLPFATAVHHQFLRCAVPGPDGVALFK